MTLADRIVILNKGNIEQFGSPDEIYSNPNNIFVAEFIGSPKMNIIKINKKNIQNNKIINFFNNKITFENFDFEDEIYLGIRPEDINVNDVDEIQIDVRIDLIENLGFEKIVHTSISNNEIKIKTSKIISENFTKISFSKDKIYLFDRNKNRIR